MQVLASELIHRKNPFIWPQVYKYLEYTGTSLISFASLTLNQYGEAEEVVYSFASKPSFKQSNEDLLKLKSTKGMTWITSIKKYSGEILRYL